MVKDRPDAGLQRRAQAQGQLCESASAGPYGAIIIILQLLQPTDDDGNNNRKMKNNSKSRSSDLLNRRPFQVFSQMENGLPQSLGGPCVTRLRDDICLFPAVVVSQFVSYMYLHNYYRKHTTFTTIFTPWTVA